MPESPVSLPVDAVLPEVVAHLRSCNSLVICAPTGAGKTTRIPITLLNAGFADSGDTPAQILMLEPRRIAARSAARRMAQELGEVTGRTVGYKIRFDESVSRSTRVLVVTEGILLRRLQDDSFLDGVNAVIFDEFHERRLDSDLALAMTRRIQQTVRPDLRIVVMSATLDSTTVSQYLGNCPTVVSEGRLHPVRIAYQNRQERLPVSELAARGVESILPQSDGDVLVFLPGVGEIIRSRQLLEPLVRRHDLRLLTLFGDMPAEDQDEVLTPSEQRRVILSTNVAETSVTIPDVSAVVDSGLARQMRFDASVGLNRLELSPISRASAEQRAGRAGRTRPGICLRLWDEMTHRHRPEFERPELERVDLSSAILRLYDWGESDFQAFPWFEPPPPTSLQHAVELLTLLEAISDQGITQIGRLLVRLPLAPRLGRMLLEAHRHGVGERGSVMAAMLSERDPFMRHSSVGRAQSGETPGFREIQHSRSDILDRLHAFENWIRTARTETPFGEINRSTAKTVEKVARQIANAFRAEAGTTVTQYGPSHSSAADQDEFLMQALVAGFPDRVARRRDATSDRGVMVGGRGVRLSPRSAVQKSSLFLCVEIDDSGTDASVRLASEVNREWLPESRLCLKDDLFFHPTQRQIVARRRLFFSDLLIEESPAAIADHSAAASLLYDAAVTQMNQVLPPDSDEFHSFLERLMCLRLWMPELEIPESAEPLLCSLLKDLCCGRRSFAELKSAPWLDTLKTHLGYPVTQAVEREAPDRIPVPSGSRIRLSYERGRSPVLAVRIQEMFGMRQTPRIAGGRVPVVLHLLAPNMRVQQITDDLESFWINTYPEVRKELKRRYPKHAWPENPLDATPQRKGNPPK